MNTVLTCANKTAMLASGKKSGARLSLSRLNHSALCRSEFNQGGLNPVRPISALTQYSLLAVIMMIVVVTGSSLSYAAESTLFSWRDLGLSSEPQPYDSEVPDPAKMLEWNQKDRVSGLRNTYRMYDGDVFTPGAAPASPLPKADYALPAFHYIKDGKKADMQEYIRSQSVTGLLILKNGEIVHEYYGDGNTDTTLWTSRSVAKSIVSVLMGMAVKEGFINSVNDPIVKYIPELEGSAWEPVTLHELMQHTSGIGWNEDYTDPKSDFAVMTQCEAGNQPFECVFELIKSRPAEHVPGEVFSYNTGGAWLVGVLLERVTGTTIAKYLEKNVWQRYPMEHEGVWQALVKDKVSMGGHGFHATLRDWGRVGLLVQNNGVLPSGEALLPNNWIELSTRWTKAKNSPSETTPDGQYGYQWWFLAMPDDVDYAPKTIPTAKQTFWALGIYGQYIGINQAEKLVLVQWSAQKEAESEAIEYEQVAFFNALAEALHGK